MTTDASLDYAALAEANLTPVLGRYFQRSWSHGVGHRLYDSDGRAYLDFANGIAVTSLGHVHPRVTAAIHAQVDKLIGPVSAIGFAEPISRLAVELAATFPAPLDSVMFLNSGSEVIDGALKLARRVTGRPGIIAFRGGFHGRTFGATSVTTSNLNYRSGYEPLLPGVHIVPYPVVYPDHADEAAATDASLAALQSLFASVISPSNVGSILIEPVMGEGGYNPAPAPFLRALRDICDRHGILLIADEVQCGYGRTGKMWAFEHAGIVPDVVVVAKAIANGLPLSAIVSSRELAGALGPRRTRLDVRRQPGGLRCRPGGPRDDARRAPGRERSRPRRRTRGGPRGDRGRGRSHRRHPRPGPDGRCRVHPRPLERRA